MILTNVETVLGKRVVEHYTLQDDLGRAPADQD